MQARVATLSLKGKVNFLWEDLKNGICVHEEYLAWSEFQWIFKKKYLSDRYFDDREK